MHMVQDLETGGLERLVAETTLGMDRGRFNIEVCCFDTKGGFTDQLVAAGIYFFRLRTDDKVFSKKRKYRLL